MTDRTHERTMSSHAPVTRSSTNAAVPYALLSLRLAMGWLLFHSGLTKLLDPNWSAAGYLTGAVPESNPVNAVWHLFAASPLVDLLVQSGLFLTGLGLLLGAFVRWNALWAAVMMALFWASSLPLETGLLVDQHVVYVLVLATLAAGGVGRIAGLDALLERSDAVRTRPWLRYLLG